MKAHNKYTQHILVHMVIGLQLNNVMDGCGFTILKGIRIIPHKPSRALC